MLLKSTTQYACKYLSWNSCIVILGSQAGLSSTRRRSTSQRRTIGLSKDTLLASKTWVDKKKPSWPPWFVCLFESTPISRNLEKKTLHSWSEKLKRSMRFLDKSICPRWWYSVNHTDWHYRFKALSSQWKQYWITPYSTDNVILENCKLPNITILLPSYETWKWKPSLMKWKVEEA